VPTRRDRRTRRDSDADAKQRPSRRRENRQGAQKKAKRFKTPSQQALARQVSQELAKLRPILKDIGSALLDRLDGELAVLSLGLAGEAVSGDLPDLPRAPILSGMLADIQALKVKPKKGRVKDLGRLEALLESLSRRMPPET
jgi:hypothetical protein